MYRDEYYQQVKYGIVEDINFGYCFIDCCQYGFFLFVVFFKLYGVSGDYQQDDQDINL